jgi:hypothetical protein
MFAYTSAALLSVSYHTRRRWHSWHSEIAPRTLSLSRSCVANQAIHSSYKPTALTKRSYRDAVEQRIYHGISSRTEPHTEETTAPHIEETTEGTTEQTTEETAKPTQRCMGWGGEELREVIALSTGAALGKSCRLPQKFPLCKSFKNRDGYHQMEISTAVAADGSRLKIRQLEPMPVV